MYRSERPEPPESVRNNPHRDPGDAWAQAADGHKYWGRFGAAGLLAYDAGRDAILLQHRVAWSDHGGTWGIPGGARHQGEDAVAGALRESDEEAGVPPAAVEPRYLHVVDRVGWGYTTVIAEVTFPFEPEIGDAESIDLAWVPLNRVDEYELHPAFAASWPLLRPLLQAPLTVVVDAANVVGTVPDGWWKNRLGAAARLRDRLAALAGDGVPASFLPQVPSGVVCGYPRWLLVVEGFARGLESASQVEVVSAPAAGDDEIVAQVRQFADAGGSVVLITSDAELRARALDAGAARVSGARSLLDLLDALGSPDFPGPNVE